jgi:branched-chain amino acid transport system substrate-binding protein
MRGIKLLTIGMWTAFLIMMGLFGFAAMAAESIKIGAIYPLTGSVAYNGQSKQHGAKIAEEEINAKGGIMGRSVQLIIEDGQCKPADSVNAAEKLIVKDKVTVIAGAFCSGATAAVIPVIERYKIPFVSGVSSNPALTTERKDFFFRACPHEGMYAPSMCKLMVEKMKAKNLAFIAVNDDWGRGTTKTFTEGVEKAGGKVVTIEYFEHGETNFAPLLTKIKGLTQDGVFVVAETQDGAMLMRQYKEMGVKSQVFGVGSLATDTFAKLAGPASEGIYVMAPYVPSVPGKKNEDFIKKYRARAKEDPDKYSLAGYDVVYIIAQAIERAKSTEPAKIREALEKTNYEGVVSKYDFDNLHQAHTDLFLVQMKKGKPVFMDRISTVGMK